MRVRFTQSARKHKIGRGRVLSALETAGEPDVVPAPDSGKKARLKWIVTDDRGVELEIMGVETPDYILVIHVMPTALLRGGKS